MYLYLFNTSKYFTMAKANMNEIQARLNEIKTLPHAESIAQRESFMYEISSVEIPNEVLDYCTRCHLRRNKASFTPIDFVFVGFVAKKRFSIAFPNGRKLSVITDGEAFEIMVDDNPNSVKTLISDEINIDNTAYEQLCGKIVELMN